MDRIVLGNLELDRDRFEARIDGRLVGVTYTQFQLLYQLAAQADRVVERDDLLQAIWGTASAEEARKLRIHISRLRKRIAESRPWRIKTVTKRGYALVNVEAGIRLPPFVLAHAPGRPSAQGEGA